MEQTNVENVACNNPSETWSLTKCLEKGPQVLYQGKDKKLQVDCKLDISACNSQSSWLVFEISGKGNQSRNLLGEYLISLWGERISIDYNDIFLLR